MELQYWIAAVTEVLSHDKRFCQEYSGCPLDVAVAATAVMLDSFDKGMTPETSAERISNAIHSLYLQFGPPAIQAAKEAQELAWLQQVELNVIH